MIPQELKYAESHEWAKSEGKTATVGITHYAQKLLSDIVFIELPEAGRKVAKGDECAVIESCKIAAELYSPVSGKIKTVNNDLREHPEYINQDPYGKGWIVQIEMTDPSELDSLWDAERYRTHIEKSE